MIAEVAGAIHFLTRIRVPVAVMARLGPTAAATGAGAFGLVGGAMGALAAIPVVLLADRAPLAAGGLAVAVLAIASGALHIDGLADTADALAAPSPEAAQRARQDPRVGAAGAAAVALALLVDASLLAALAELGGADTAALACIVAAAGSRAMAPIVAAVMRRAPKRSPGPATGLGTRFAAAATDRAASLAGLTAVLIGAVAAQLAREPALLAALLLGGTVAVAVAAWLHGARGGLDGDGFGFVVEVAFGAILLAAAAFL